MEPKLHLQYRVGRAELYPGREGQTQADCREHSPSWKNGPETVNSKRPHVTGPPQALQSCFPPTGCLNPLLFSGNSCLIACHLRVSLCIGVCSEEILPWVISSQLLSAPEAEEVAHTSEVDWKAPDGESPNRRDALAVLHQQSDVQTTEMDRPGAISRKPPHCALQRNRHIPPCSGDLTTGAKACWLSVPVVPWLQTPAEALWQTRNLKSHCCPLAFAGKLPGALLLPCNQLVSTEPSSIPPQPSKGSQTRPVQTNGGTITAASSRFLLVNLLVPQRRLLQLIKTRQRSLFKHELESEKQE